MKWSAEIVDCAGPLFAMVQSGRHGYGPEQQIDQRREEFSHDGLAQNLEKVKRLQVREHGWSEQSQRAGAPGVTMSVMYSNRAAGVMCGDVPLFDPAPEAGFFHRRGNGMQITEAVRGRSSPAKTGEIHSEAGKTIGHVFHHAIPKTTAGGKTVEEENRWPGAARANVD